MSYYLQTRVWIRESNPEEQKMRELGIGNDGGQLISDDLVLDILGIDYMYPCTMIEENDSTYIKLKRDGDIILARPFKDFSEEFFNCLKDYNSLNG